MKTFVSLFTKPKEGAPIVANLGSNNSMYYNAELKRWVEPGTEEQIREEMHKPPLLPPKSSDVAARRSEASIVESEPKSAADLLCQVPNFHTLGPGSYDKQMQRPKITSLFPPLCPVIEGNSFSESNGTFNDISEPLSTRMEYPSSIDHSSNMPSITDITQDAHTTDSLHVPTHPLKHITPNTMTSSVSQNHSVQIESTHTFINPMGDVRYMQTDYEESTTMIIHNNECPVYPPSHDIHTTESKLPNRDHQSLITSHHIHDSSELLGPCHPTDVLNVNQTDECTTSLGSKIIENHYPVFTPSLPSQQTDLLQKERVNPVLLTLPSHDTNPMLNDYSTRTVTEESQTTINHVFNSTPLLVQQDLKLYNPDETFLSDKVSEQVCQDSHRHHNSHVEYPTHHSLPCLPNIQSSTQERIHQQHSIPFLNTTDKTITNLTYLDHSTNPYQEQHELFLGVDHHSYQPTQHIQTNAECLSNTTQGPIYSQQQQQQQQQQQTEYTFGGVSAQETDQQLTGNDTCVSESSHFPLYSGTLQQSIDESNHIIDTEQHHVPYIVNDPSQLAFITSYTSTNDQHCSLENINDRYHIPSSSSTECLHQLDQNHIEPNHFHHFTQLSYPSQEDQIHTETTNQHSVVFTEKIYHPTIQKSSPIIQHPLLIHTNQPDIKQTDLLEQTTDPSTIHMSHDHQRQIHSDESCTLQTCSLKQESPQQLRNQSLSPSFVSQQYPAGVSLQQDIQEPLMKEPVVLHTTPWTLNSTFQEGQLVTQELMDTMTTLTDLCLMNGIVLEQNDQSNDDNANKDDKNCKHALLDTVLHHLSSLKELNSSKLHQRLEAFLTSLHHTTDTIDQELQTMTQHIPDHQMNCIHRIVNPIDSIKKEIESMYNSRKELIDYYGVHYDQIINNLQTQTTVLTDQLHQCETHLNSCMKAYSINQIELQGSKKDINQLVSIMADKDKSWESTIRHIIQETEQSFEKRLLSMEDICIKQQLAAEQRLTKEHTTTMTIIRRFEKICQAQRLTEDDLRTKLHEFRLIAKESNYRHVIDIRDKDQQISQLKEDNQTLDMKLSHIESTSHLKIVELQDELLQSTNEINKLKTLLSETTHTYQTQIDHLTESNEAQKIVLQTITNDKETNEASLHQSLTDMQQTLLHTIHAKETADNTIHDLEAQFNHFKTTKEAYEMETMHRISNLEQLLSSSQNESSEVQERLTLLQNQVTSLSSERIKLLAEIDTQSQNMGKEAQALIEEKENAVNTLKKQIDIKDQELSLLVLERDHLRHELTEHIEQVDAQLASMENSKNILQTSLHEDINFLKESLDSIQEERNHLKNNLQEIELKIRDECHQDLHQLKEQYEVNLQKIQDTLDNMTNERDQLLQTCKDYSDKLIVLEHPTTQTIDLQIKEDYHLLQQEHDVQEKKIEEQRQLCHELSIVGTNYKKEIDCLQHENNTLRSNHDEFIQKLQEDNHQHLNDLQTNLLKEKQEWERERQLLQDDIQQLKRDCQLKELNDSKHVIQEDLSIPTDNNTVSELESNVNILTVQLNKTRQELEVAVQKQNDSNFMLQHMALKWDQVIQHFPQIAQKIDARLPLLLDG